MKFQSDKWIAAAHLVRRTGFGATGAEVDAAVEIDPAEYVAAAISAAPGDPGVSTTPPPSTSAAPAPGQKGDPKQTAAENNAIKVWWLHRMAAVEHPLRERLTFGWHNHFATSIRGVTYARYMLNQNTTLREGATGPFGDLARAMLKDAAMLRWLNGQQNRKGAPNENLSREFLELFTLGHDGGYTETDVKEGARALTGWMIQPDGSTYVDPKRQDTDAKTVLGVTSNLDADGFCDAVLDHPSVAVHLAMRWWGQLVSDSTPPPSEAIDRIIQAFGANLDLSKMFAAIYSDPEFAKHRRTHISTPVEWLVGVVRAFGPAYDDTLDKQLTYGLRGLGQLPFEPPSVGGWPSGAVWMSSAAVDMRLRIARLVIKAAGVTPDTFGAKPSERIENLCYRLGIGELSDRSYAAAENLSDPIELATIMVNTPEYLIH